MNEIPRQDYEAFVEEHKEETIELLKKWASIPAPSHQEEQKALAVRDWLRDQGAGTAFIDKAGNVVFEMGCQDAQKVLLFMAHLDVVFPDTEPFVIREEDGKLLAPGIGDDTANLVQLMMAVKYILTRGLQPPKGLGLVFAANTCEEGLGNLKGSRYLCTKWGSRIAAFLSLDGYTGWIVTKAVGSQRYKITVRTEGGHSYSAFGNPNAIHILSGIIQQLYSVRLPKEAKTTYNVGTIEGGTTINSIAQKASMTYEFRSESHECLHKMEEFLNSVIQSVRKAGWDVELTTLGIRPCNQGVDETRLGALSLCCQKVLERYETAAPKTKASSTDANIPLSMGIPACTVGCVKGGGAHTREEWIWIDSMVPGQKAALGMILSIIYDVYGDFWGVR
ncbi:MAG: M20/M25/M40 family metallo-hydrolase [Lachnospiraceae bacterium]|nr:M20/M25/M40 family metallo-hydrolase [Lachnospiraceae bacterium]